MKGIFRDLCFVLPFLLLALPAGALEITHVPQPRQDLPSSARVLLPEQAEPLPLTATRRLELMLFDNFGLKPEAAERMRLEVEQIFASMATDIEWMDPLSEAPVEVVGIRLRVILIPSPPQAWGLRDRTMGVVFGREGLVDTVYIFPPAVMRTLQRFPEEAEPNRLQRQNHRWARALGRVVGHEIIHAVAPDHPHAPNGLLRARQSRFSLSAPELALDALCAEVFMARLQSRMQTAESARIRRER
ncbi:MAG: hypothetical protein O7A98_04980 [Acidobacteria bacterium]|nr:hypothetical protein [Acidobacteriota bacterium]